MLNNYKYIPEEHKIVLQSVIRNHQNATSLLLAATYEEALNVLDGKQPRDGFLCSLVDTPELKIGTATAQSNGIFIQLARIGASQKAYITVGQKWMAEQKDSVRSTTNTVAFKA